MSNPERTKLPMKKLRPVLAMLGVLATSRHVIAARKMTSPGSLAFATFHMLPGHRSTAPRPIASSVRAMRGGSMGTQSMTSCAKGITQTKFQPTLQSCLITPKSVLGTSDIKLNP
jgi:hypothetical protein